ncbi:MAG TPA: hypothetical protein VFG68_08395 [Fimbriiglobus sp.]|nr:hypothetical protein [Fimbriiglobus sp.]
MSMFFVFRSGRIISLAALVSALLLPTFALSQTPVYQWDFNTKDANSTVGVGGTASLLPLVNPVSGSFKGNSNKGGSGTIAFGSSDPGTGDANFVWQTTGYPAASGTGGYHFEGVNTTGLTNLLFAFDLAAVDLGSPPTTASKWYQVRYSMDGTTFTNLGGPLEYQQSGTTDATLWANQTVLSLAGVTPAANLRFEVVSVHAPGTSAYAPAQTGTSYSGNAPVFLDYVTVYQGNTWNSTAPSGDIQTGSNWSNGAPAPGGLSSNLMFGGNENTAAVTVSNANSGSSFRLLSISFTSAANSTAYTLIGDTIDLGRQVATSSGTNMTGAITLINASNRQQTISASLSMNTSQVWDSGPTANGGSLLINGPFVLFSTPGSGMTLTVAGENETKISAPFTFFGTDTITKTGGGTLTLPTANTNGFGATVQFNVNGGSLAVTNAAGSATADAAIRVNAGRLTGNGFVAPGFLKTVTVASGGAISPGSGTGDANRTLTVSQNGVTVLAGGVYEANFFGTGANDTGLLRVVGSGVSGGGGMTVNLRLLNGVNRDTLRQAVGIGNTRTYTLTNVDGASTWTVTANNFTAYGFSPGEWTVSQVGNNLVLTFVPVPDARFALGVAAAGLLALAAVRRKKLAARTVSGA